MPAKKVATKQRLPKPQPQTPFVVQYYGSGGLRYATKESFEEASAQAATFSQNGCTSVAIFRCVAEVDPAPPTITRFD